MNREILFRGIDILNENWVYGYYNYEVNSDSNLIIHYDNYGQKEYQVEDYGIGQYTGLKDTNGVKIFEGDIVTCIQIYYSEETVKGFVQYSNEFSMWFLITKDAIGCIPFHELCEFEVIGNITDSPELL